MSWHVMVGITRRKVIIDVFVLGYFFCWICFMDFHGQRSLVRSLVVWPPGSKNLAAMLRCAYMLLEVPKAPGGRRPGRGYVRYQMSTGHVIFKGDSQKRGSNWNMEISWNIMRATISDMSWLTIIPERHSMGLGYFHGNGSLIFHSQGLADIEIPFGNQTWDWKMDRL